jgi:ribosome-binding factor A
LPQTHRLEKVNQLIRAELSDMLLRETKDPRLSGYISVNAVQTTPDLRHAKVQVSCVCEEEKKIEILDALHHSSGFFRSTLARHLKMRRVPELHFVWDTSIERGSNLLAYMDKVVGEPPPPEDETNTRL